VLVRSRELKDGVERLEAGGRLTVGSWPSDEESAGDGADSAEAASEAKAGNADQPGEGKQALPSGAEASRTSKARTGTRRISRRVGIETLLERADEARIAGDRAAAQRWLQRVVADFPSDPRAAISAFQLGVLELELGMPERAVASFGVALERASSLSLRDDCYLRLVEAQLKNGSASRAERVARSYRAEFPDGRHQGALARLLARSTKKKSGTLGSESR
jgi:TolA-binding protein